MSTAVLFSRGLDGMDAPLVTVEVHLAGGLPAFNLVGLPETEVKESRDRVRVFFEVTLDQGDLMAKMQPVRVPRTLPVVLSRDEAARLIAATRNLKHQTALSVAYGAGLRASEVIALKVGDVD